MASDAFDDELAAIPAAQKGPPRWMVRVGCGCLIPGFIILAVVAWVVQTGGALLDQNSAWESLAKLVHYDDSVRGEDSGLEDDPKTPKDESRTPVEFELLLGGTVPFSSGVDVYWFGRGIPLPGWGEQELGPDPLSITIVKLNQGISDQASRAPAGTPIHEDRTFTVNGQTLRGRVVPEMVNDQFKVRLSGLEEVRGAGAIVWLREGISDPNEKETLFDLLVFFQRPNSSVPITDAEVERFLAPFDLETFPSDATEDEGSTEDTTETPATPEPKTDSGK